MGTGSFLGRMDLTARSGYQANLHVSRPAPSPLRLAGLAHPLGDLQRQMGLPTSAEEYAFTTLNFGLMEVVYEWAQVRFGD